MKVEDIQKKIVTLKKQDIIDLVTEKLGYSVNEKSISFNIKEKVAGHISSSIYDSEPVMLFDYIELVFEDK